MKGVKYVAPLYDFSGYGEASRNYVLSLHRAGVPVTVELHCFDSEKVEVGSTEDREILNSLVGKDIEFDVVIVHLTPDFIPHYRQKYKDKYLISYTVWETSLLHPAWASCCNYADEVWVPCDWNVKSFKDSGVTVPVYKIHHGIDVNMYDGAQPTVTGLDTGDFTFLSIMQWNSRKNPEGLLRAYFNAFTSKDNVRLVLKTYIGAGMAPSEESKIIKNVVSKLKADMQLPTYPRVSLITSRLSSENLRTLYLTSDAYVSLTRGEGFGLCMFEAGLAGIPVIATGMGGNMEYMDANNSYPVPFSWDYVSGMSTFNRWYLGNQEWAHPHLPKAAALMFEVFSDREGSKRKGQKLKKQIKSNFSWEAVAEQMLNRLERI